MPNRLLSFARAALIAAALAAPAFVAAAPALADKVHLKDGRVLDGRIVREGDGFVFLKIRVGSLEQDQLISSDQIERIERDTGTAAPGAAPETAAGAGVVAATGGAEAESPIPAPDAGKSPAAPKSLSGATRVAILNFGPPQSLQGKYGDMVGVQVNVEGFKQVIPLLEKAKADVVVIRINSGGGYGIEVPKFHALFEKEYKPRFRTVAWVESSISAAAMSPWVIEEIYFMPKGSMGACTGWSGQLQAVKGLQLEMLLKMMEEASAMGRKDPKIMRAMQIQEPLSVDIAPSGDVVWRQDEHGQFVLNHKNEIYTMNAADAVKFKFARGIASTKEELAKAMGLEEVEWVAADATEFVDKNLRENDSADKHNREVRAKYDIAIGAAQQSGGDKDRRAGQITTARRLLEELRRMAKINPNFEFHLGLSPEWFEKQEEILRKLSKPMNSN